MMVTVLREVQMEELMASVMDCSMGRPTAIVMEPQMELTKEQYWAVTMAAEMEWKRGSVKELPMAAGRGLRKE